MADLKNIFDVAARGMSAQMVRLNTVASNLANARSVASSEAEAYRAIKPVLALYMQMTLNVAVLLQLMLWISSLSIESQRKFTSLVIQRLTKMATFIWQP